jgi:putative ABC transport system substrate-binding protein
MVAVGDPVGSGLVKSLARPGGNVTGVAATPAVGKQLELVRELRPKASRVGILWNPANLVYQRQALAEAKEAAAALKMRLQIVEARRPEDFDRAFATIAGQRVDALLVMGDPVFTAHSAQLAELGVKHRLATVSMTRESAERGFLVTYGPSFAEAHRLAGGYVDRILKGARPAELPVEQTTKYDLVINARTARALGLTVPAALVSRADQVIP